VAHTEGPWALGARFPIGESDAYEVAINGGQFLTGEYWGRLASVVVKLEGVEEDSEVGLANAALITAAPDLLAACVAQQEADEHSVAVSKATEDGMEVSRAMWDRQTTLSERARRLRLAAIAKAKRQPASTDKEVGEGR
jgi:hypothetical protein